MPTPHPAMMCVDSPNFANQYCYDVGGKQSVDGRCGQVTSLYSDEKAQRFLNDLTAKLRIKLDRLQVQNGYNRGRYELTHAPVRGNCCQVLPATRLVISQSDESAYRWTLI